MRYIMNKDSNIKESKNKKYRNKSLLMLIVFIISLISNSISPKTLLVEATENNKFEIDNVSVEKPVTSDDNIFELTREVEKISENEIKVSVNIKVNKENIPVVNNEVAVYETQEESENIIINTEEIKDEIENTVEIKEEVDSKVTNIDEENNVIEKYLNNMIITESLIEGFTLVNDSITLEEIKVEGNGDLTEALRDIDYTDLSMESLENKLDITLKNVSYEELKLSYLISTNNSIKALDNIALFSESLLKYNLVENNEEKTYSIPNALVSVKEMVQENESEEVNKNQEEVESREEIQENEEEFNTSTYSTFIPEAVTYDLLDLEDNPTSIDFPITIRDFKADHILFQPNSSLVPWLGSGMVTDDLGENKKPIFKDETIDELANKLWNNKGNKSGNVTGIYKEIRTGSSGYKDEIISRLDSITSLGELIKAKEWYEGKDDVVGAKYKEYNEIKSEINTAYKYIYYCMNKFFEDTSSTGSSPLNTKDDGITKKITLTKNDEGLYSFSSSEDSTYQSKGGFFAADGEGFGNEGFTDGKKPANSHNYHFSLESHSRFFIPNKGEIPSEGLVFDFTGDDDVWAYVDNKLVIDLGGIHSAQQARFIMTQEDNRVKITRQKKNGSSWNDVGNAIYLDNANGTWVNFDFFYMERNTTEANLKIQTNIKFVPKMTVEKEAYLINDKNEEVGLNNNDAVYPGETVYYKLILRNTGNVDLTNISFEDEFLDVIINENGVYTYNGEAIDYSDLTVIKNGEEIKENKLNALNKLEISNSPGVNTYIEIKSKDFLKYTVKESDIPQDAQSGEITNRVVGKANYYTTNEGTINESAEATITVIPTPITETIVKLDANIEKIIDKVVRGEVTIYPNESNDLPRLVVGDKVTFKFDIQNNSTSRTMSYNGQISNWVPIAIEGLKLEDILTINGDKYSKDITVFYTTANNPDSTFTNPDNFSLDKNSKLTLYSDWIVNEEQANHYNYKSDYDVINTIKLLKTGQGAKELDTSSVEMKIQPPSLLIEKVIADGSLHDSYSERTFTIMVKGSDGTQYNIEAEASTNNNKEIYTLENLKYGVTYTISEIVPMNYEQQSITINGENINSITLTSINSGSEVQITNKKVNDKFWTSENKVINEFKYTIKEGLKFIKQIFNFKSKGE